MTRYCVDDVKRLWIAVVTLNVEVCWTKIEGRISGLLSFLWWRLLWFEWESSSIGEMVQYLSHLHCSNSSKKENLARSNKCVARFLKLMMDQILKKNNSSSSIVGAYHTALSYQYLSNFAAGANNLSDHYSLVAICTQAYNNGKCVASAGHLWVSSIWIWLAGWLSWCLVVEFHCSINLRVTHKDDQLYWIQLQHSNTHPSWEAWAQYVDTSTSTQGLPWYPTCLDKPGGIFLSFVLPLCYKVTWM